MSEVSAASSGSEGEAEHAREVLSWRRRAGAAPWVPGKVDQLGEALRSLLRSVAEDCAVDRRFVWPSTGSVTTVRDALRGLGACGLASRPDRKGCAFLTADGQQFADTGDMRQLVKVFHSHVKFIGEILAVLLVGDVRGHRQLNQEARDLYQMNWTTLDQIRRRTGWLRAAGLVDLWDGGNLVVTDSGRLMRSELNVMDTSEILLPYVIGGTEGQDVEVGPPGDIIGRLLSELDLHQLQQRKPQMGYLAGGSSADAVRRLIDLMAPESSREAFVEECAERLGVKRSSAQQSLHTLRALGLVHQTGRDEFSLTDACNEWLSTDNPIDLLRILHCRVALFGEVLWGLPHAAETGSLCEWLRRAYPDVKVGRSDIVKRLSLFEEAGLVEYIGHTSFRVSGRGAAFADSLPLLPTMAGESDHAGQTPDQLETSPSATLERCAQDMVEASRDSAHPGRFEHAVGACFKSLGVQVETYGGPGRTDLCLTFWNSPTDRKRVIVEVKTDSAGVVGESDIKFDALEEHRRKHEAEGVLVIGPGFGGRVPGWALDRGVRLVTADELAEWLSRSARSRLLPRQLYRIAVPQGCNDEGKDEWATADRALEALHHVVRSLWNNGNDPREVKYGGGALNVRDIWRMGKDRTLVPEEIQQALDFLTGPLVLGADRRDGEEYLAAAAPGLVAARLRCLADAVEYGLPSQTEAERTVISPMLSVRSVVEDTKGATTRPAASAVRAWARAQGRTVSVAGRLPQQLADEYTAAQAAECKRRAD